MAAASIVKTMSKANDNWYAQNSRYIAECEHNTSLYVAKQEGVAEGKAIGLAEGAQHQAIESAITLLKMNNLSPEEIAQAVNLPLEKVLELQKEIIVKALR